MLFESVASCFGRGAAAVILTGDSDGATGRVDHIPALDAIAPMLLSLVTSGYAAPLTSAV